MLSVRVDEQVVDEMIQTELRNRLEHLTHRYTFWDMKELCRQTNMSENFVKEHFFYEPDFPKYRVGRKWLMPAKETEEYLLAWIKRQSKH